MKNSCATPVKQNCRFLSVILFSLAVLLMTTCKKGDDPEITPQNNYLPPVILETDQDPLAQPDSVTVLEGEEANSDTAFMPYRVYSSVFDLTQGPGVKAPTHWAADGVSIFLRILSTVERFYQKKDFEKTKQKIDQLIQMDRDILKGIGQIQAQLQLMQVDILKYISTLTVNQYITSIQTAYSTTSPSGLLYFTQFASDIQNGKRPLSDTVLIRQQSQTYIDAIYQYHNPDIVEKIAQINGAICPPLGGTSQSVLNSYTDYVLLNPATNFGNQEVHKPENVMKSYLLVENYFLHLIIAQMQGVTIMGNIYNSVDTSGNTFNNYLNGTVQQFVKEETEMFLLMTDKLMVNLVDFRNVNNFLDDIRYLNYGICYDNLFRNIIARSRIVCGLLRTSVNLPAISYAFTSLVPARYNGQFALNPLSLSLTHNGQPLSVPVDQFDNSPGLPGIFPYPAWSSETQVSPDNRWFLYTASLPPSDVRDGSNNVSLSQIPWSGTGLVRSDNLSGTYTALYYNPKHPDPKTATPTPTDSNTYKFGCTVISWRWGDLMTMRKTKNSQMLSSTWRDTPSMTYTQQQTNPTSIWMQNNGRLKWEESSWTHLMKPDVPGDTSRLYHHYYEPYGMSPKREGFKLFMAKSVSTTFNVTPTIPASTAKPVFFYAASGLAFNSEGGNTPCHTQYCLFLGGLGGFSNKDNIPNNLFEIRTNDFSKNYYSFLSSGVSPFDAGQGDNRFTLAWQLCVDGAYKKPRGFSAFLPRVHLVVYGQMVYQGNWNIFNR